MLHLGCQELLGSAQLKPNSAFLLWDSFSIPSLWLSCKYSMGLESCCWKIILWISSDPVQQCCMWRGRFPLQFAPWLSQCCEVTAPEQTSAGRGGQKVNRVHIKASCNRVANPATVITFTLVTLCVCLCVNKNFGHLIYHNILDRVKFNLWVFWVKGIGFCVLFSSPTCPVIVGVSSFGKCCV